jgi:sarcosine oxidase, subunit gamma
MTALVFDIEGRRDRLGLKGPRAAEWLVGSGITLPMVPNSWASWTGSNSEELLVARLGTTEFFLEETGGTLLQALLPALCANLPGVYPVLREDSAFQLSGEGVHEVLAQVCNVNFADLALDSHPVIMTLMIGVAVLVVPQEAQGARGGDMGAAGERRYRIWCDPTFGPSLGETLGTVVVECGGTVRMLTGS